MTERPTGAGRIAPGATIGIVGGGQLGRMTAMAAAELGYKCHIFCPEADEPAAQVSAGATAADYTDEAALDKFAAAVDVVTFEFENIPYASARRLAERVPVRPGPEVLRICQNRIHEKEFFRARAIPTAEFAVVREESELAPALARIGRPAVLKTAQFGYDGKGQARISAETDPAEAWAAIGGGPAVLEAFVDFRCEISAIVARGTDGAMQAYDIVENRHVHHILDTTVAPAKLDAAPIGQARRIATELTQALDVVGLLAVEMFVTKDGRVLANEMAPRPHNSGHWTMDACLTGQFEQLVRAVCGLPLGAVDRIADAVMKNLIGDAAKDWPRYLAETGAKLHLYGKSEIRPGRKMGHVTYLSPKS